MINIFVRMLFVLLLEVSICAMIDIHGRFIIGAKPDEMADHVSFYLACLLLAVSLVLLVSTCAIRLGKKASKDD